MTDGEERSVVQAISDGGPMERYARMTSADEAERTMLELCRRLVDGETLKRVAKDWGLPRIAFAQWVSAAPEREALYLAALRVKAGDWVDETVALADAAVPEAGFVAQSKLAIDTRLRVAGFFDRARFGAQAAQGASVRVVVDRSCGVSLGGARVENETTAVAVDLGVL